MPALDPAYRQHRRRMIAYGRWEPFRPADRAAAHIRRLSAYGIGWQQLSRLSGVDKVAIEGIMGSGGLSRQKIRPETETAILAVRPILANVADHAYIDATGTRRRLQAMACNGWNAIQIGAWLGQHHKTVAKLMNGERKQVTGATARAVAGMYEQLFNTPPPAPTPARLQAAEQARKMARKRGWHPHGAWDKETIDDPAAAPADYQRPKRRPAADTAAELEQLMGEYGLTSAQAAERLGIQRGSVNSAMYAQRARLTGPGPLDRGNPAT